MENFQQYVESIINNLISEFNNYDLTCIWIRCVLAKDLLDKNFDRFIVDNLLIHAYNYIIKYKELWKSLDFLDYNYEVSTHGNLRTIKTGYITKGYKHPDGYLYVTPTLSNSSKKNYPIHRLVAIAFINNPEKKSTVDHIDKNRENNLITNLRWANSNEQNNNRSFRSKANTGRFVCQYDLYGGFIKCWNSLREAADILSLDQASITKCCKGERNHVGNFIWRYYENVSQQIQNEIWKLIPLTGWEHYMVSNMGRVKDKTGRIFKGNHAKGYINVTISTGCGKSLNQPIHKLVIYTFIGSHDGLVVNHKNGIKTDNRLENLEVVTQQYNVNHANIMGLNKGRKKGRQVTQLDLNGNFIDVYQSAEEAALNTSVGSTGITAVCRGERKTAGGFLWKY